MQVRKLIRLLTEMVEKEPSTAYMKACVDRRYAQSNPQYKFIEIPDIQKQWCVWEPENNPDRDTQREVVVLGNY